MLRPDEAESLARLSERLRAWERGEPLPPNEPVATPEQALQQAQTAPTPKGQPCQPS